MGSKTFIKCYRVPKKIRKLKMALFIRKIRSDSNVECFLQAENFDSVKGDVVTELNISDGGDLSVWKVENPTDISEINQVYISIAASLKKCEDIQFLLIDEQDLTSHNLTQPIRQSVEIGLCDSLQNRHHNIKEIEIKNIKDCLQLYYDIISGDDKDNPERLVYIEGSNMAKMLLEGKKQALINDDCNKELFNYIKNHYKNIYNEVMNITP